MTTFNRVIRGSVVVLALLLGGCATSVHPQLGSLLVRQGEPSMSFDDPASATKQPADSNRPAAQLPKPSIVQRTSSPATIEKSDGRLKQALDALQLHKTVPNYLEVAAQYRRLRIMDEAFENVEAALALDKRSASAYELRAQTWRDSGFASLGLGDAHRAVFLAPRSASAHNTLGTMLQAVGHHQAARSEYLDVVNLDASAGYAWSNLCFLSLREGDHERAIEECKIAVQTSPALAAARNNMALSYATAGKLAEAREELYAIADPAEAAFNLGMLYLAAGDYQLAEEAFSLAVNLRPRFAAAETRRRQSARLSGPAVSSYDNTDDGDRP